MSDPSKNLTHERQELIRKIIQSSIDDPGKQEMYIDMPKGAINVLLELDFSPLFVLTNKAMFEMSNEQLSNRWKTPKQVVDSDEWGAVVGCIAKLCLSPIKLLFPSEKSGFICISHKLKDREGGMFLAQFAASTDNSSKEHVHGKYGIYCGKPPLSALHILNPVPSPCSRQ